MLGSDMGCGQPDYTKLNTPFRYTVPLPSPSWLANFGPPLFLSNRRETVVPNGADVGPQNMMRAILPIPPIFSTTYRVYIWH